MSIWNLMFFYKYFIKIKIKYEPYCEANRNGLLRTKVIFLCDKHNYFMVKIRFSDIKSFKSKSLELWSFQIPLSFILKS